MEEKLYRLAIVLAIASLILYPIVGWANGHLDFGVLLGVGGAALVMAIFYAGRYVITGRLRAK